MDPLSLTTGIISLYGTCMTCFVFFTDVKNADQAAKKARQSLEIRSSALKSWGHYWEISTSHDTKPSEKLRRYMQDNVYKALAVQSSLSSIAETLSDSERLLKRYGIKLEQLRDGGNLDVKKQKGTRTPSPSHLTSEDRTLRNFMKRLDIMSRCRWVLADNVDIKALDQELRSHTDLLYQLCPEDAIDSIQMIFAEEKLRLSIGIDALTKLAEDLAIQISAASSRTSNAPSDGGLELLEHLTELQLKAQRARQTSLTEAEREQLLTVKEHEFELRTPRGASETDSTLAIWKSKKRTVYIEFRSYKDERGYKNKDIQEEVLKLSSLFRDKRTSIRLHTLEILGIFKNSTHGYVGFVHALPPHLETVLPTMTDLQWNIRRPHTLSKALEHRHISQVPLGTRFELARSLLKSVVFLHTSGWLHKNIRSESVIFFPRDQLPLTRGWIDWHNVILLGYKYARLSSPTELDGDDTNGRYADYADYANLDVPKVQEQITLDVYQHPTKRTAPNLRYQSAYDMYSLGLVLLEIGLWEPLAILVKNNGDPNKIQGFILDELYPRLLGQCGEMYADVVRDCISMGRQNSEFEKERQRNQALRMYANLGRCFA